MDRLFLEGIDVYAHGGVTEGERAVGQHFRVDVTLEMSLEAVSSSDSLEHAVSYVDIYSAVRSALTDAEFNLIETAASRVADAVLQATKAPAVTVRLRKLLPPLPGVSASGVEIRREG